MLLAWLSICLVSVSPHSYFSPLSLLPSLRRLSSPKTIRRVPPQLAAVEAAQADPALNSKLDKVRWLGVRNVHGVYVVPPTNRRAKSGGTSGSGGVVVGVVGDQEQVDEACTETVEWACRRKGNMSRIPELARG